MSTLVDRTDCSFVCDLQDERDFFVAVNNGERFHLLRENGLTLCGVFPPSGARTSFFAIPHTWAAGEGWKPCRRCTRLVAACSVRHD